MEMTGDASRVAGIPDEPERGAGFDPDTQGDCGIDAGEVAAVVTHPVVADDCH